MRGSQYATAQRKPVAVKGPEHLLNDRHVVRHLELLLVALLEPRAQDLRMAVVAQAGMNRPPAFSHPVR
jgi:hypothetical protein